MKYIRLEDKKHKKTGGRNKFALTNFFNYVFITTHLLPDFNIFLQVSVNTDENSQIIESVFIPFDPNL